MPSGNSHEHGGNNHFRFASGIDRLVDLEREAGGRATSGASGGGSTGAVSSEASDAVNKALVTLDADDSTGVQNFSIKLAVGVNVVPLRHFLANVDVGPRTQGS